MAKWQSLLGAFQLKDGFYSAGVWDVSNVLEATFQKGDFEPHTLSIEVEDVPGVLNQVSSAVQADSVPRKACLLKASL